MDSLVEQLSRPGRRVQVITRPAESTKALEKSIERGYVHLRFPETRGGTEVGVTLDRAQCELTRANFDDRTGVIRLVGAFSLNFVRVECVAAIDLSTLSGEGQLIPKAA